MAPLHSITRRGFVSATVGALASVRQLTQPQRETPASAKNLILFNADGLSPSALAMADVVHRTTHTESLFWIRWLQHSPNQALIRTEPADWLVTDSAAAASAWSVGQKVNNGSLCVLPDGSTPLPLFHRLGQEGYITGLLTTTSIHDASVAAMVANVQHRDDSRAVLDQYAQRETSFMIGGGLDAWRQFAQPQAQKTKLFTRWSDRQKIDPEQRRQFLLLAEQDLPNAIDRRAERPTFTELAQFAVEKAASSGKPFALFLENEQTDTLGHRNDAASLVREIAEIDITLRMLHDFVAQRDDTLLVVLTDHGNAAPNFILRTQDAPAYVKRLSQAQHSLNWVMDRFGSEPVHDGATLSRLLQEEQGVTLTSQEIEALEAWLLKELIEPIALLSEKYSPLGSILSHHFGTGFVSDDHTAELVPVIAIGPGSDRIRGAVHHVDVHKVITAALGIPPTT